MYGWNILCEISKGTFEIPYKISYLYIERYDFLQCWKFKSSQIDEPVCVFLNAPGYLCSALGDVSYIILQEMRFHMWLFLSLTKTLITWLETMHKLINLEWLYV